MSTDLRPRITLIQYYKSARGLSTAIAAVALPLISLLGPDPGALLFPPLGDMDGVARVGLIALGLGVSLGVYFLVAFKPRRSSSTIIWATLSLACIFLFAYLCAYQRFVRRIDVPSRATSVYVSVGYKRTAFADKTFGTATDWEMLRARGTSEEEIQRLWTTPSLVISRLTLFLSFALTTLLLLFLFSFALAHDITFPSVASAAKN